MGGIKTQLSFADDSEEYKEFVNKFKPKKTTDDCYTPANVYEAVLNWCRKEYNIPADAKIIRPFFPGGDYEREPYPPRCVVIDNPPFSIVSQICQFYEMNDIKYFLFAPYLTNLSVRSATCHVITGSTIIYENGAEIGTGFLTNLENCLARTASDLYDAIEECNKVNWHLNKRQNPRYQFPDHVLTSAMLGYISCHHVDFKVERKDAFFIRALESQRAKGKGLFGCGYLLSEKAAAEKAAAEKAAAEKAAAEKWELSARERLVIKSLG